MVVSSVRNPFVEAWMRLIASTGAEAALVVASSDLRRHGLPQDVLERTFWLGGGARTAKPALALIEEQLGGPPDSVFIWWGFGELRRDAQLELWPKARRILCVDTYPNASVPATELREWFRAQRGVHRLAGLVVPSPEMARMLRRRFVMARHLPILPIPSPFLANTHASTQDPVPGSRPRTVFIGRSDFLFSSDPRMAKDAVGPDLERMVRAGIAVDVRDPGEDDARDRVIDAGFGLYESHDRDVFGDSRFSDFLASYHGVVAGYRVANRTIHRRVSNGLSTRFSNALGAPAAILVPRGARFAENFFERRPIGFTLDPGGDLELIGERILGHSRRTWWDHHDSWAGEAVVDPLTAMIMGLQ